MADTSSSKVFIVEYLIDNKIITVEYTIDFTLPALERIKSVHFDQDSNSKQPITIPVPLWMNKIYTPLDFQKNPLNKDIWQYLTSSKDPLYEGENLFVDAKGVPYIRLMNKWVPVDTRWLKYNPNVPSLIVDEYNIFKTILESESTL
ncbi:hypothetical protein D3C78_18870 [compost metagenome]